MKQDLVFNYDRESLIFSLLVVAEESIANSELLSVVIWLGLWSLPDLKSLELSC